MTHEKSYKRVHAFEAAGAGDAGYVTDGSPLGPCPSCGAALSIVLTKHPHTGSVASAIMHSVPFCTYYGVTDPVAIMRDIERTRKKD